MAATIRIEVTTTGGLDAVKKDIAGLGDTAAAQGGGFSSLQQIGVGALRAIGGAAVELAGKGLAAIGGFVKDSIGLAGDFQAGMNSFGAAAGKGFEPGTEALDEFHDLFLQLGKDLPVSTSEVQDAAMALVKGGLDPAVLKAGALESSLQFAAAAGMELADAAELTVKQLGTFVPIGASVEEQTRFMADAQNLLVKAAGASTLDVDKLGDAMLAAGGQARAAGLEYEDFVTTMGLISPSFGSAAEAGTSFKNFLTRLNPTTKPATDAMIALGLATEEGKSKFFDAQGAFIGGAQAAELLRTHLAGLTDQQRLQALQTIFGNDAMGAATALAGAGADGYALFAQKMADANGVTAQAAATQTGFNFAMENMKGSLEALQITIGEAVLPVLTDLISGINAGVGVVLGLADGTLSLGDAWGTLATSISNINPYFEDIIIVINGLIASLSAGDATVAVFTQGVTDRFNTIFSAVTTIMSGLQAFIQQVLVQIAAFWSAHGTEVVAFVQTAFTQINTIVNTIIEIIATAIGGKLQQIAAFWQAHGAEIQALASAAWTIISNVITAALALIQGVLQTVLAAMKGDWEGAWSAIQTMSATFVQAISNAILGFLDYIAGLFGSSLEEIMSTWTSNFNQMQAFIGPILSSISSSVSSFASGVSGFFSSIGDAISGVIGWVGDLADKLSSIDIPDWLQGHSPPPMADWFSYIGDAAGQAGAAVGKFQDTMKDGVGGVLSGPSTSNPGGIAAGLPTPSAGGGIPTDLARLMLASLGGLLVPTGGGARDNHSVRTVNQTNTFNGAAPAAGMTAAMMQALAGIP
jgi:TP901 family phage tail tape measure protein